MLRSLVTLGYLMHDRAARTYAPTVRVARLAQWATMRLAGAEQIDLLTMRLGQATGETILIGVQNDIWAHYVRTVEAQRPVRYVVRPGTQRLLIGSGVGWCLLSMLRDEAIASIARRSAALPETPARPVSQATLMRHVRTVRRDGIVVSRHTVNEGVGVIAAPLPRDGFEVPLAVGVAGPVERLDARQSMLTEAIRAAIRDVAG